MARGRLRANPCVCHRKRDTPSACRLAEHRCTAGRRKAHRECAALAPGRPVLRVGQPGHQSARMGKGRRGEKYQKRLHGVPGWRRPPFLRPSTAQNGSWRSQRSRRRLAKAACESPPALASPCNCAATSAGARLLSRVPGYVIRDPSVAQATRLWHVVVGRTTPPRGGVGEPEVPGAQR